jgi:hypothetical protein
MSNIKLGDKVKDKVTGYEGIATARVEYLNGCTQYGVSGKVGEDGKVPEALFIDHTQLEVVAEGAVQVESQDTGGPTTRGPRAR